MSFLACATAFAESGLLNLNGDLGLAAPLSGRFGTAVGTSYAAQAIGPRLRLGIDYQFLKPLALEASIDVGAQFIPSWLSIRNLEKLPAAVLLAGVSVGPRLRLLDTERGNL